MTERTRAPGPLGRQQKERASMETVEVDHTPLDILLMDGQRPRLTGIFDQKTMGVLSWHLNFESPGSSSIVEALHSSIERKWGAK